MSELQRHVPPKIWPLAEEQFGYYLAGLIDGNGHILAHNCRIIISSPNTRFLFKLRSALGFGKVSKDDLIISNKKGLLRAMLLIRGKLRNPYRILEFNSLCRLYSQPPSLYCRVVDWNTPWFAGYWETQGKMSIRARRNSPCQARIIVSDYAILEQIKTEFGGTITGLNISNKRLDTYSWTSGSQLVIYNLLGYFDRYSLQSDMSYLSYIMLRKAYILTEEDLHICKMKGLMKLKKSEEKMW